MNFKEFLTHEMAGKRATPSEYEAIFAELMSGGLNNSQIAALLSTWSIHGASAEILAAGAKCLRQNAKAMVLAESMRPLCDNCGTGGDGMHTFNISTGAAIVAAAAGARVAKHGNRSVSSKCGSADLLFAAGLPESLSAAQTGKLLEATGFTFFFAPNFHPLIANVMPVRRELGIPTVFNLLGPLANPIAPEFQVIGVSKQEYLRPVAEAAKSIGINSAWIVCSEDGLDEVSPGAKTHVAALANNRVSMEVIDPEDYGMAAPTAELVGGDSQENLVILKSLLAGQSSAVEKAVCLNAGAVLFVAGLAPGYQQGIEQAKAALSSGKAKSFFDQWLAKAREIAS